MNKVDEVSLILVAKALGDELLKEVVFVGGVTTSLYIENERSPNTTPTEDVDLIVNITSSIDYESFEKKIGRRGFKRNLSEPGPLCRFYLRELVVDFMPLDEKILGFSNSWYKVGFEQSENVAVGPYSIRMLSFAYFLATKLEAFANRGAKGFMRDSKDFEDLIVVLNGRNNLLSDLQNLPTDVSKLFKLEFGKFVKDRDLFLESVTSSLYDFGPRIATDLSLKLVGVIEAFVR